MSTFRESVSRFCYKRQIERYRGGYRLKRFLLRSVPVKLWEDMPAVYLDVWDPNWQAKRLFLGETSKEEAYEPHVAETLRKLIRPGDTAYDIGANIGLHSIFMHQLGAKVYAFEPNPKLISNLRRTFKALRSAKLFHVALSDECGTATLFVPKDHDMASLGDWRGNAEKKECTMSTLDALHLPKPDIIKCDVEGAELKVFRGGADILSDSDNAPIILFEEQAVASGTQGFAQDDAQKFLASLPSRYEFFIMNRETCELEPIRGSRPSIWCDLLAVPACRKERMTALQPAVKHARAASQ